MQAGKDFWLVSPRSGSTRATRVRAQEHPEGDARNVAPPAVVTHVVQIQYRLMSVLLVVCRPDNRRRRQYSPRTIGPTGFSRLHFLFAPS